MKRFVSVAFLMVTSAAQAQQVAPNPRLVATDPDGTCFLEWSPDGQHVQVWPANERQFVEWGSAVLDLQGRIQKNVLLPEKRVRIEQGSGKNKLELFFPTHRVSRPLQHTESDEIFGFNSDQIFYGFRFQTSRFSKDEREVSVVASGTIYKWNTSDGKLLSRVRLTEPQSWNSYHTFANFSPDGRFVVASLASDPGAALFNTRTGRPIFSIPNAQEYPLFRAGFLLGNRFVATKELVPGGKKVQFSVWSVQQKRKLWICPALGNYGLRTLAQASLAVVVGAKGLELRDVATGKIKRLLSGPTQNVDDVAPSPDGSQIWTSQNNGQIWSWRVR